MLVKPPLTYTRPPPTATDDTTEPSGLGFQGFSTPVVRSIAASPARCLHSPTRPNSPPTYTVSPVTASALTKRSGLGFQSLTVPVSLSSAATNGRLSPPTVSNQPPT